MQADRWGIILADDGNKYLTRNGLDVSCLNDQSRPCSSGCVCFQPVIAHKLVTEDSDRGIVHAPFIESLDLVCCALKLPIHDVLPEKQGAI